MNIVEAYIKFNKKLIILISGLSGSGKTKLASNIERDFKIKKINIETYCEKTNDKTVKLSNDVVVKDWDHIDSYDWEKINSDVIKNMESGVIICGPYFPTDVLSFTPDFHINIKISKQQLIQKRHEYIEKNPDKCKELVQHLNTPTELMIINKITFPHYIEYTEKSKIDKYINAHEIDDDEIYDQAADFLFFKIKEYLNNMKTSTKTTSTKTTPTKINEDDSSSDAPIIGDEVEREYNENQKIFVGHPFSTYIDDLNEKNQLDYLPK